ncbi:MAG: sugar phosphate isomerase/epimerase [Theionarchaea archaeon]|nr:sugar phosphate isomerase/epimerase [Theionarchaea archaeon]
MKLGLVTYNMAKDWDIATIIENCQQTGFEGVELRTTHAHGVEETLTQDERKKVRETFESSDVKLVGLGSAFEYHSVDPEEVRRNIEGTNSYTVLARDVGAEEVKVRPNALQVDAGIPVEKTLEQIGLALRECGEFAEDYDIEIRLEVHGRGTNDPKYVRKIMDFADHDNVFVCWNSNNSDIIDGSVRENFDLLKDKIRQVHMRDLFLEEYPWGEMLGLLGKMDFKGFCLAEVPESPDPIRVMNYYRALWKALSFPRN